MENYIKAQITINAPISKVWDALINPDVTAQYMFGCRVTSDWTAGSTVDWVGMVDGKPVTFVTGKLITLDAPNTFVYSVIDPLAAYPHTPENHLIVSCHLTEADGVTALAISQGDYTTVAEGEKRYGHGTDGWDQLLVAIKNLLETA
jgi:uncharacterized protein YndB with AHSA1/START domain